MSTRGHGLWWEGGVSMLMEVEPNTRAMRTIVRGSQTSCRNRQGQKLAWRRWKQMLSVKLFLYLPKLPTFSGALLLQVYSGWSMTFGGLALCGTGPGADALKTHHSERHLCLLPLLRKKPEAWGWNSHITKAHNGTFSQPKL